MSNMPGTPAPVPQQGKSRSWLLIVIILVVVCCLVAACLGLGYYLWSNGDRFLGASSVLRSLAAA